MTTVFLHGLGQTPDSWQPVIAKLPEGDYRCPSLILCGEKDGANKKASLGLSRRIPGSKLSIVPKSGHEVNKDAPEELAQLLREFWRETE